MKNFIQNFNIRINGIGFLAFSMFYIYISVFIFLIGWIKPIYSIPFSLILFIFIFKYLKDSREKLKNTNPFYINIKMFIFLCFFVLCIGLFIGWLGFSTQTGDWVKHNCVLSDLTTHSWPVYYTHGEETSMLTYYLGQYLFPSLIGKIFSSTIVTFVFNGIWAMIGLLLAFLGILKITNSNSTPKQILALAVTIAFSSCIVISQLLVRIFIPNKEIFLQTEFFIYDNYILQYSSNLGMLRWVMPQIITPWIIFSILHEDPFDIKHYVLICLPMLLYSSFAFLGMIFFLLVLLVINTVKNKDILASLKHIFSLSNVCITLTLGLIFILYFSGNVFSEKPYGFEFVTYKGSNIIVYLFFVLSILPYTFALFSKNKTNPFYWISTAILLLLPFFKLGINNDFCMRVSIIPLFVYMCLSIELLHTDKESIYKVLIIILLLIGNTSSSLEFQNCISIYTNNFTIKNFDDTLENYATRKKTIASDLQYNYFTYDLDNSLFYKYLAKKKLL